MPTIELYTTPTCPYCLAAKALLDKKGVAYTEHTVIGDPAKRQEMLQRAHGRHHRAHRGVALEGSVDLVIDIRLGDDVALHGLEERLEHLDGRFGQKVVGPLETVFFLGSPVC